MKVEISRNSWHAKLYKFVYAVPLPVSLCPYFWTLLLAVPSVLLFGPVTLLAYPLIYVKNLFAKYPEENFTSSRNIYNRALVGLIAFVIATLLFTTGKCIYDLIMTGHARDGEVFCTAIFFCVLILIIAMVIDNWHRKKKKEKKAAAFAKWQEENPDKDSWDYVTMLRQKESIKRDGFFKLAYKAFRAWYEKNCPLIDWK